MVSEVAAEYYSRYPLTQDMNIYGKKVMLEILEQTQLKDKADLGIISRTDKMLTNVALLRARIVSVGNTIDSDLVPGDVVFYDRYAAYGMPPANPGILVIVSENDIIFKEEE